MVGTTAVRIRALAGSVTVTALDDARAAELERLWSRCGTERVEDAAADAPREAGRAVLDGDRAHRRDDAQLMEDVVSAATAAAISSCAGERLLFHGGALADPVTGAAIAVIGPSGAGKTTATLALGERFGYLTDETVAIDAELGIAPFPKPLSILETVRPKRQRSPDELGLLPAPPDARLAVFAIIDRDAAAEAPVAEPLELAELLALVAPQSSSLARMDRGLVRLCETLARCRAVVRLRYSEARGLAPLVRELLAHGMDAVADAPTPAPVWEALDAELLSPAPDAAPDAEPAPGDAESSARLRRAGVADGIAIEGGLALLTAADLAIVCGIGVVVWSELSVWRTREELVARVVEAAGPHPRAAALVDEAVEALEGCGLIERR